MTAQLKAQYSKVNELRAQKSQIEGDDPCREMTNDELKQLFAVSAELTEAVEEMKRLESAEETTHPSEQADF